jgi:hypothetical protein
MKDEFHSSMNKGKDTCSGRTEMGEHRYKQVALELVFKAPDEHFYRMFLRCSLGSIFSDLIFFPITTTFKYICNLIC